MNKLEKTLLIYDYIVNKNMSVAEISIKLKISETTIRTYINKYLKEYDEKLFLKVKSCLKHKESYNKRMSKINKSLNSLMNKNIQALNKFNTREEIILFLAKDLIDNNDTVGNLSKKYCIAETTLFRYFKEELKYLDKDLYKSYLKLIDENKKKRNKNGAISTCIKRYGYYITKEEKEKFENEINELHKYLKNKNKK